MNNEREGVNSSDRPVNKRGAVTFLDVLGWKGIWQKKDDPIRTLDNLRRKLEEKVPTASKGRFVGITDVVSISDTIVLLTEVPPSESPNDALTLHGQLCAEILLYSLEKQIPLRGATGFGEFSVNAERNLFVGKAIDETASWYEQGVWIGVFMTPSALYSYSENVSKWWIRYEPPLKNGIEFNTFSAVWMEVVDGEKTVSEIITLFERMSPIVPELLSKFSNTQEYLNKIKPSEPF